MRAAWFVLLVGCGSSSAEPATPAADEPAAVASATPATKVLPCVHDDEKGCTSQCESGELESCVRLARIYNFGNANVAENTEAARTHYEKACEGGIAKACYWLASSYKHSKPSDPAKSAELDKKALEGLPAACDGGDGESCQVLSDVYRAGLGVPKDEARAVELEKRAHEHEKRACDAGDASECAAHGGNLVSAKDFTAAAAAFQKGCDGGDGGSCSFLAALYDEGVGVKADPDKARTFFELACRREHEGSCRRLSR